MKNFSKNFLLCGIIGWCTEIIFTSLQSIRNHDLRLLGVTSLWMFPIYGLASLLVIPYRFVKNFSFLYNYCNGSFRKNQKWGYNFLSGNEV